MTARRLMWAAAALLALVAIWYFATRPRRESLDTAATTPTSGAEGASEAARVTAGVGTGLTAIVSSAVDAAT